MLLGCNWCCNQCMSVGQIPLTLLLQIRTICSLYTVYIIYNYYNDIIYDLYSRPSQKYLCMNLYHARVCTSLVPF